MKSHGTYDRQEVFIIPEYIAVGDWYVIVDTDADNQEYEYLAEDNNVRVANIVDSTPTPIHISHAVYDLAMITADAPENVEAGSKLNVSWKVKNLSDNQVRGGRWYDRIYLSKTGSLDDAILLASGMQARDLPAGGSYEDSRSVNIPSQYVGSYSIIVVANSSSSTQLREQDYSNNSRSLPIVITRNSADLVVSHLDAASEGWAGSSIAVSWTVTNAGTGRTDQPSWEDAVVLSEDLFLSVDDIVLGSVSHSGFLSVDARYRVTGDYSLPAGMKGEYHILVVADSANDIWESSDENNVTTAPLSIAIPPLSDLTVTKLSVPTDGWTGHAIDVSWTVSNDGEGWTSASSWRDAVLLSNDATRSSDDLLLGTVSHYGTLLSGSDYSVRRQYVLPYEISGDYYLLVESDLDGSVAETSETNNVLSRPIEVSASPSPNLVPTKLTLSKDICDPGDEITVTWEVKNQGVGNTIGEVWTDQIYLSRDSQLDIYSDHLLATGTHTGGLEAKETYVDRAVATIPQTLAGDYYIFIVTDAFGDIYESDAENDNALHLDPFVVNPTSLPDLVVTETKLLQTVAYVGQTLKVEWQVSNQGTAPATGHWFDTVYLSLDKVFDATSDLPLTPLKLYSPDNPSAGFLQPPYNRSGIFQLPKGFVGQYYVIFVTDVLDDVVEFNSEQDSEANNVLCHPIPVTLELPHTTDLILESVTVATSIGLGETLNVSYTIKNSSTEDIDYYWTDAVYLSADSTLDSTDRLLTKVPQSGLAAVSRRPMSVPAVVSGVPEGDYYIIVVADVYDQIDEGDGELTNRVSSDSMVQVQVQNLRLGTWVADSFTPLRERYYRLDTGEELDLLFTLDSDSTTASNELFVRRGTPPDRGHYDYRYPAMGQPDQEIVVSDAEAGAWYVLAYSERLDSTGFRLRADVLSFGLRAPCPTRSATIPWRHWQSMEPNWTIVLSFEFVWETQNGSTVNYYSWRTPHGPMCGSISRMSRRAATICSSLMAKGMSLSVRLSSRCFRDNRER